MAEPYAWWEAVPTDQIWDPLANPLDWSEPAAQGEATEPGGSWARDDASVTLIGDVPAAKKYDARRKMLGYAYADAATPWAMHRVNPLPHNEERMLRCVIADIAGYNPYGAVQPDATTKAGYPAPYLTPSPLPGTILLPRISTYTRAKCTLKFKPHAYPFIEDADMVSGGLSEVYRNTAFFDSCDPLLELLLTDTQAPFLEWAETAAGGPTVGAKITAQMPEYVQKASFVAVWYGVPQDYIIDSTVTSYIPSKIMAGMGKVNDATWYGFPAGTLRLEAPRFRKSVQAVIRLDPTAATYRIPFSFDVSLPFTYLNPDTSLTSPLYHGWNVFPYGPDGKWYSIRRTGSAHGPYFPSYDFNKLFDHVQKP